MARFNLFNRKIEDSINKPSVATRQSLITNITIGSKRYADAYLWAVYKRVFAGLTNVDFHADTKNVPNAVAIEKLCAFLETYAVDLVWQWWSWGFICVGERGGEYYIPRYQDVHINNETREVINFDIVMYSDTYRLVGKSDFNIIASNTQYLDSLKNSEEYLTTSLGTFGILSGDSMGMQPQDKQDFLDGIKKNIGTTREKFQFLVMNSKVDFQPVTLPAKDLAIQDKIDHEVKLLCTYFGVPYDLVAFSGQSTYANQAQSVRTFYRDCISPLAEVLLSVGRYMLKRSSIIEPMRALTFSIDNVPELADDRTAEVDYRLKLADLASKMASVGADNSNIIKELEK